MTHQIKVLNKNDFEIVDYFDGIAYRFAPNVAVNVPPEAARHIFGVDFLGDVAVCASPELRSQVFNFLQKRWGWNSVKADKVEEAKKLFENLVFTPVVFKLVETTPVAEEISEPRAAHKSIPAKGVKRGRAEEMDEEEEVA